MKRNIIYGSIVSFIILLAIIFSTVPVDALAVGYQGSNPGTYYQVTFDGEGEAYVLALVNHMNTGNEWIYSLTFEVPGKYVDLKYVFQKTGSNYWDTDYVPISHSKEQLSQSVKYTISLGSPIKPGDVGTIMLYYKAFGYVNKFINFDFDFETMKSPYDTEYTRVAITSDSEFYIRGSQTRTDYRSFETGFVTVAQDIADGYSTKEKVDSFSRVINNVRYAKGYVNEKRNLDPWESFHVTGTYNYADAWFLTYYGEIVIVIIAIVLFWLLAWKRIKEAFTHRRRNKYTRIASVGALSGFLLVAVSMVAAYHPVRYWYTFSWIFAVAMGIIFLIIFLAPAYYVGKRYGLEQGILTVVSTIIWFLIFMGITSMLLIPAPYILY